MSTSELRELLIDAIRNIEDAELLEDIYQLLTLSESTIPYVFNDEELRAIKEAEDQIRNGDYLTDEEVNKEVDEWINK